MHFTLPIIRNLNSVKNLRMISFTHGNMIKVKTVQVHMTPSFVQLPPSVFTMKCSYSLPELLASTQLCKSCFTKSISSPFSVHTASFLHFMGSVTEGWNKDVMGDWAHTCHFNSWEADAQGSLGDTEFLASLGHRPRHCLKQQRVLET